MPPTSPRLDRKSDPHPPRTPVKEATASQLYHKSFSDLNKGLDFIFQSKSRPPSRASNFGDITKDSIVKKETEPGPPQQTVQNNIGENNAKEKQSKVLVKSLSRKNLYEEMAEKMEDFDVYHTITGGRTHNITATRTTNPFSKIRRTANKGLPLKPFPDKIVDDDVDNESVFSEDMSWRVREPVLHLLGYITICLIITPVLLCPIILTQHLLACMIQHYINAG